MVVLSGGPYSLVPYRERLRAVLANPLYRSGHALMLKSVLTAAVGLLFWLVAAHLYSPVVVGRNSAEISAMMFLAGIAQLNLMSALLRFIPTAGRRSRRIVVASYLVGTTMSAIAAIVFLLGLRVWAPELAPLVANPFTATWFVLSAALWAVFVMQDSVLVAVKQAWMVPTQNVAFSVLKLVLVASLAATLPTLGIFMSWTAAMALAVIGTTLFLFIRAIPAHTTGALPTHEAAGLGQFVRFTASDYLGAMFWIAATALMPVLVLDLTGAAAAAAFAMAWTITLALYQLPIGMGQSLVVHAAADPDHLLRYHRQALGHSLRLLLPAVVTLVIAAPWILRLFGPAYASQGTGVLRFLALSALPQAVTTLAVSKGRVQRRMRFVVALLACLCLSILGVALALLPVLGIIGVGIAWFGVQTAAAVVLLATTDRGVWKTHSHGEVRPHAYRFGRMV